MQTIYNQYNKQTQEVVGETTKIAFNYSIELLEKQFELLKDNSSRQLQRMFSVPNLTSPEAVLSNQQQYCNEALVDLKKIGETYYQVADSAGQELLEVAKKGQAIAEQAFGETVQNTSGLWANGKSADFPKFWQDATKTAGEIFQNNVETAVQTARSNTDTVLKGQKTSAKTAAGKNNKAAK